VRRFGLSLMSLFIWFDGGKVLFDGGEVRF